jgi:hypothetical protein
MLVACLVNMQGNVIHVFVESIAKTLKELHMHLNVLHMHLKVLPM